MRRSRVVVALPAVLAVLSVLTVAWFESVPRYRAVGPALAVNGTFAGGLDGWTVSHKGAPVAVIADTAELRNANPDRVVGIRQILSLPPGVRTARLEARFSVHGVVPGSLHWQNARVYLVGRSRAGELLWTLPFPLAQRTGTHEAQPVSGVYHASADAADVVLGAKLAHATGTLRLERLQARPVVQRVGFTIGAIALAVAWVVAAGQAAIATLMGLAGPLRKTALAAAVAAIALGVLLPGAVKQAGLEVLVSPFQSQAPVPPAGSTGGGPSVIGWLASPGELPGQLAHGLLFFGLAAIVFAGRLPIRSTAVLGLLLLFAAGTEVVQYFALARQPNVVDWLWDAAGIVLAAVVALPLRRLADRRAVPAPAPPPHDPDAP